MKVIIALPCYNVEDIVQEVLSRIDRRLAAEIVAVDDGSSDRTAELVRAVPGVTLLQHRVNRGYGATQQTIFDYFRSRATSPEDALVLIHGDGEMLPEEIPDLLKPLENPEVEAVLGSRMIGDRNATRTRQLWKRWLDRGLTLGLNLAYGNDVSTYFGGFRAVRKSLIERLDYENLAPDHFFDMQIILRLTKRARRYVEIPITNVERRVEDGLSYSRSRVGLRILQMMLQGVRERILR